MVLNIADLYFQITADFNFNPDYYSNYLSENPPRIDKQIHISVVDLEEEAKENAGIQVSKKQLFSMAVFRKICIYALEKNTFLMHGVLVEYRGHGYLFSALSGTGKTTHAKLWIDAFGAENVCIINGDKPLIRAEGNKLYGYGTPWCGKEGYQENKKISVDAICFVERAKENSVLRLSAEEALPKLLQQVMVHNSFDLAKQLELIDILVTNVPLYRLCCNMDLEAAKIAYEAIKAER